MQDRVRGALRGARPHPYEVRVALAGRVQHAFVAVIAYLAAAEDPGELCASILRQRGRLDPHLLQVHGRPRRGGRAEVLVEEGLGLRGKSSGMIVLAPAPPAHLRGLRGHRLKH